jgi:hypothetical protein
MSEDSRCCGTGTCIISADGVCWCGQQWDGEKMCFPKLDASPAMNLNAADASPAQAGTSDVVSSNVFAARKA